MTDFSHLDTSLPVDKRVGILLDKMTLEEKVGQMMQENGCCDDAPNLAREGRVGSFLHTLGQRMADLQDIALNETRLRVPILFGIDAIRGHGLWKNATLFPPALGLACSWNTKLLEAVARVTAKEVRATGPQWTFSPQCDLCRDIRWGRFGETYGEDPYVTGELAAAMVRGYQGENLAGPDSIAACPKHFAGYGDTEGARDAAASDISEHKLRSIYLPPFKRVVDAGAATFMIAYQTINGQPATTSPWLLRTILKEEWGFSGFTVTDWSNVGRMLNEQFVCADMLEAAIKTMKAGTNMIMVTPAFYDAVIQAVKHDRSVQGMLDEAVTAILTVKFKLGMFDDRAKCYPDAKAAELIGCENHRALSLQASRESTVLLKNEDGFLPVRPDKIKKIAVIGPGADDFYSMIGGWSLGSPQQEFEDASHDRMTMITVLDGLRARFDSSCEVVYEKACRTINPDHRVAPFFRDHLPNNYFDAVEGGIDRAVELAVEADLTVVVLGDTQSQFGEMCDRLDMNLGGEQQELVEAIHAAGVPFVAVLQMSKPHTIPFTAEHAKAVICMWNQGQTGGQAVAEMMAGDYNPSAKLTCSWPKSIGQQPVNYSQLPGWHVDSYMDGDVEPLYAFGFGLSYTQYHYRDLQVEAVSLKPDDTLKVSVTVDNTGCCDGMEIVQCYVNDKISSTVTPVKLLKAWQRVMIPAHDSSTVTFEILCRELGLIDAENQYVVEPGAFEVMVGPSSRNQDLLKASFCVSEP